MSDRQHTYVAKKEDLGERWDRDWWIVDATDQRLGRLASRIARILMGKHKPIYTPHVDVGDYVVVINAEQIELTGDKPQTKLYRHHSGHPGGLRERSFAELHRTQPTEPVYEAVRRMLPDSTLGRRMLKKLKVYAGPDHPHEAQQPTPLEL